MRKDNKPMIKLLGLFLLEELKIKIEASLDLQSCSMGVTFSKGKMSCFRPIIDAFGLLILNCKIKTSVKYEGFKIKDFQIHTKSLEQVRRRSLALRPVRKSFFLKSSTTFGSLASKIFFPLLVVGFLQNLSNFKLCI